jgi:peptide/nickel transport system permease protein
MGRYILRRIVVSIPVMILVTIAIFTLINFAPGDPLMAMIDPEEAQALGEDYIEQRRAELGLDDPIIVRYGLWLGEVARGNLGYSLVNRRSISEMLLERLVPTLKLMAAALSLAILIAVPIGVLTALRQYSLTDYVVTIMSFTGVSIPNLFLALGAIYLFALTLDLFPTARMTTVGRDPSFLDSLHHLILPAAVLGLSEAAPLVRYVRSSMLEIIRQDFVTVATSKGLPRRIVVFRHALRNALIPFVTIVTLSLPNLVAGAIIVETIFAWPGMGRLAITAVLQRDYPVIMAINLVLAVLIVLSNLLADVLYAVIDPRIKYT